MSSTTSSTNENDEHQQQGEERILCDICGSKVPTLNYDLHFVRCQQRQRQDQGKSSPAAHGGRRTHGIPIIQSQSLPTLSISDDTRRACCAGCCCWIFINIILCLGPILSILFWTDYYILPTPANYANSEVLASRLGFVSYSTAKDTNNKNDIYKGIDKYMDHPIMRWSERIGYNMDNIQNRPLTLFLLYFMYMTNMKWRREIYITLVKKILQRRSYSMDPLNAWETSYFTNKIQIEWNNLQLDDYWFYQQTNIPRIFLKRQNGIIEQQQQKLLQFIQREQMTPEIFQEQIQATLDNVTSTITKLKWNKHLPVQRSLCHQEVKGTICAVHRWNAYEWVDQSDEDKQSPQQKHDDDNNNLKLLLARLQCYTDPSLEILDPTFTKRHPEFSRHPHLGIPTQGSVCLLQIPNQHAIIVSSASTVPTFIINGIYIGYVYSDPWELQILSDNTIVDVWNQIQQYALNIIGKNGGISKNDNDEDNRLDEEDEDYSDDYYYNIPRYDNDRQRLSPIQVPMEDDNYPRHDEL